MEMSAQLRQKEARHQYHFQNPKTTIGYALKLGIRKKWSKYNICTKEITSINL
jgi:hypothetical protein